ncbi:MAG: hypothetical protein ABIQ70_11800, partial [Dokdonella sp.]
LLGARLHGSLPWPSGITAATCTTQAASNCAVTTLSGNLDARFDIQSGGSIDVSGDVQALDGGENASLDAMAYGPMGLSEQETLNNFASVSMTQSLFFDGFDAH